MSERKLETFKVGDKHKPRLKNGGKPKAEASKADGQEQASTLGFARIEAILDQEDPSSVQKSLAKLVDGLEAVADKAGSAKDRAQAKRAKAAVERTCDLLTYLFETKDNMLQAIAHAGKGDADGKSKRGAARKGDK